jgi:hypothetical protein
MNEFVIISESLGKPPKRNLDTLFCSILMMLFEGSDTDHCLCLKKLLLIILIVDTMFVQNGQKLQYDVDI